MKVFKLIAFAAAALFFVGCDNGFEELNQDPNNPVTVPSDLLLTDILFNGANNVHSLFVGGDMGSTWSQLWTKVQYNDEERFVPRESVIESVWDNIYEDVIADAVAMQDLAMTEGNQASQAAALVMESWGYSLLTDCYGDIPNTEAIGGLNGVFTPVYDEQEIVFDSIFAKLDRAEELFTAGGGSISESADIMFAGDVTKWRKFGNSLKVRALMRISAVKDVSVELQELMGKPLFTSNDDNAALVYLSEQPNAHPFYEQIVFGNRAEWKVSETLVTTLSDLSDPRLTIMAEENADGEYRGKPNGYANVPSEDWNYDNVSGIGETYLDPELLGKFMTYAELQFLLAEAAEAGLVSGDASSYYSAGVTAAMNEAGITDESAIAAYLGQAQVAYASGNSEALIGVQKWIALFDQGVEAWIEWRRTGEPELSVPVDAILDAIPRRYTYPASEQTTNSVNVSAANDSQGENSLLTKVWWDAN